MTKTDATKLTRRHLLTRIGLAAGTAYVAPTLIGFNAARASGASGGGSAPSRSAVSRSSGPSRPRSTENRPGRSAPSRRSGPSRSASRPSSRTAGPNGEMPLWMREMLGVR